MALAKTERSDESYRGLDLWPTGDVVSAIIAVQQDALRAVEPATAVFSAAIEALALKLQAGGRMAYAGAGSSGMIAQMDALELPGTYGIPADRFPVLLAGGPEALLALPSEAEDDRAAAEAAVDACGIGPADGFIAIAASGRTPFTVAALRRAKARGAVTIGIACVPDSPLLEGSDHAILMETPPEVVAGSTRMGAGTAQKCALNILSTGVAVRLGHAYAGLMVNMSPDNAKLKARAVAIVAQAAGAEPEQARAALDEADWSIKTAIVLSVAGIDAAEARVRLARQDGNIRAALTGE